MADQNRIEKVQKLLALAERAGTQEEAELAYARAQDLMTKWAIDDLMLQAAGQKVEDEIAEDEILIKRSSFFKAYQRLAFGVAEANNVKVLWRNQGWGKLSGVMLIGWKSDIENVKMLYTSLMIQMSRERNRQLPQDVKLDGSKYVARWRNSFSMGYALRVSRLLYEKAQRAQSGAVDADTTGSLLPAVRDRKAQVDDFYNNIPKSESRSKINITDAAGYTAGTSAAERADIGNTRAGERRRSIS